MQHVNQQQQRLQKNKTKNKTSVTPDVGTVVGYLSKWSFICNDSAVISYVLHFFSKRETPAASENHRAVI